MTCPWHTQKTPERIRGFLVHRKAIDQGAYENSSLKYAAFSRLGNPLPPTFLYPITPVVVKFGVHAYSSVGPISNSLLVNPFLPPPCPMSSRPTRAGCLVEYPNGTDPRRRDQMYLAPKLYSDRNCVFIARLPVPL